MADRKRVYVAGPITKGNLARNIDRATLAFRELAKAGYAPFCPHWSVYCKETTILDGGVWCEATVSGGYDMVHEDWLNIDLAWVSVADAVLRLPGESKGADREVAHAQSLGIPVYYSIVQLRESNAAKPPVVSGVGPDAPVAVNGQGGKQSATQHRMDLLPARATLAVAEVLKYGAEKYAPNNWRNIPLDDHINHMLIHAFAHLAGDTQDDHLAHMGCRALMALEMSLA